MSEPPPPTLTFHIDSDELVGLGGFLALRRMRMRNRRPDGSLSDGYCCDFIVRPYGLDAIVVAVYARRPGGGVDVLIRHGMRPALWFGRDPARVPLPETRTYAQLGELVAGIIEEDDKGEAGVRTRAAAEVAEEAGFIVHPSAIRLLGAGSFPSPGSMPEKFYYAAVEVDPAAQQPLAGDGSPMEEGATTHWLDLDAAITACVAGELEDGKTELGLRRLRDALASA